MEPIYTNPDTENRPIYEPDPETAAQMKSGANWFYWIAGLSLVNSAIYAFGGDISFILGLGATQLIEGITDAAIAEGMPSLLKGVAIVMNLAITGVFALFGYYANKGVAIAFIAGIALYILDGLLYLAVGSMLAAGFHVFALFFIVRGFLASRKIARAEL
jgi:hypothetical protein